MDGWTDTMFIKYAYIYIYLYGIYMNSPEKRGDKKVSILDIEFVGESDNVRTMLRKI